VFEINHSSWTYVLFEIWRSRGGKESVFVIDSMFLQNVGTYLQGHTVL
jgi:hypothetical protein